MLKFKQLSLTQSSTFIRGFSLIEVIIVLAMISILTITIQPYMAKQIKKERISSHADQLHRIYKLARSEAIKRNENITLNADSGDWKIMLDNDVLAMYSPTHPTIKITALDNLNISPTGSTTNSEFLITDNDADTNDFRLCVYTSGQSVLTSENNCP